MKRRNETSLQATAVLLGVTAWVPGSLPAADADPTAVSPPPTAAPSVADVLSSWGIAITGYVAASYYHSSGDNTFHEFDVNHDSFQLDQAGLQVGYQPKEGFGAFADVLAGEDARILNTAENQTNSTFNARQAYVQYASGAWTLIGGKFTTLAGEEYSNPTSDTNFSRSLLFFAQPLTHTGVRATWAASGTLNLVAGINNGWNTTSTSYGSKTAELGAAFTPTKELALNLQGYFGRVPGYDAQRSFVDFVGTYNLTDALSLALNYDWGVQRQNVGPDLRWNGLAAYANYALNARWRVSARAEYLNDQDGFNTGTAQKLKEGTVTVGFLPAKDFELRLEARYDWSDKQTLIRTLPGILPATLGDNQTELALQGIYKF
jgi:Putative beta-barrel porin-2, OmpL-like. bbp2